MTRSCKECGGEVFARRGAAVCTDCQEVKMRKYQAKYQAKPEVRKKKAAYMARRYAKIKNTMTPEHKHRRKIMREARREAIARDVAINTVLKEWGEPLSNRSKSYEKPKV